MNAIAPSPRTKPRSQKGWVIFLYSKGRAETWLRSGSHSCSDSTRSVRVSSAHDSPEQRSLQHNHSSTKLQHKLCVSAISPLVSGLAALPARQPCSTALKGPSPLGHRQHEPAGREAKPGRLLSARLQPPAGLHLLSLKPPGTHT